MSELAQFRQLGRRLADPDQDVRQRIEIGRHFDRHAALPELDVALKAFHDAHQESGLECRLWTDLI